MARKLRKAWIQAYLDYVAVSEAPKTFHLWSAIHAVSASLKKNVWIQWGFYKIYPNQYIVLVGPPGVGKGTAINPAVALVKKAKTANYISDRITAEKIIEKLSVGFSHMQPTTTGGMQIALHDTAATIVSTELPIFLQASEWMLPLMCEMWDKNEFSYETKNSGSFAATDICVGLIGGCVPDYIRKINRDATAAITGGFSSRCIFCFASEKGAKIAWPDISNLPLLEKDLFDDLQEIRKLNGAFTFDPAAKKMWENWYNAQKSNQFDSDVLINFRARKPSHIFKTAMVLSVSEGDSLVITRDHLFNSIKLVDDIEKHLDVIFRAVGESPLAAAQDRILRYMELKGIASRPQILKDNFRHVTDEQLTAIMFILENTGLVVYEQSGSKWVYRLVNQPNQQAQAQGNP